MRTIALDYYLRNREEIYEEIENFRSVIPRTQIKNRSIILALGSKCDWCDRTTSNVTIQVDHILGKPIDEEIRLLCIQCHKARHVFDPTFLKIGQFVIGNEQRPKIQRSLDSPLIGLQAPFNTIYRINT